MAAGAPAPVDPLYKAGLAAGLGAFYDALVARGLTREEAQELLWAAYEQHSKVAA